MFGYIRPLKPELRIREYESYKAVYCGLCGQLGKSFGPVARMSLSYDFTFLSMLHYAVSECGPSFKACRCYINPLRRVPVCVPDAVLSYGADVAAILLYHKLMDNIRDASSAAGRAGWSLLRPIASSARKKAALRRPDCEETVSLWMERQAALEERSCANVDEACDPTAQAMSAICGSLTGDSRQKRVLERIGYLIGRYIYLCDALDDLPKDIKTGNYNPFVRRYKLHGAGEDELEALRGEVKGVIRLTAGEAAKAYQLLDTAAFGGVLENIFCQGLRAGADEILAGGAVGRRAKHD